ncbi:serine/threonine-protein kinase, active site protein [Artemisia annua]|uniref:non-specific serine/threonine protein kinase n=1 Tax=Artemisia annua TaxID=35608 RepID=A0A2U1L6T4_ARTAN|nr:serine/threonine-protein kinase, active site protein [Artemisia annua]
MALPRELAHLRIQLKDILDGTDNFDDANLIGEGGFVRVYKGTLSQSKKTIDIAARRFHPHYVQGEVHAEFWKEIMMLHNLKHKNVVKIIGFCDENDEKIIINKYVAKGSLDKYLSDPTLTWMQRLQICVDVAHALKYIHYHDQRDFSVVHRNIKSSKILLNENWEPELYGFEISLKHAKARRHRALLAEDIGTIGYVDPTYKKIGFVTHKSDVYSLGVVLFEVLCGRRAFIPEKCASSLTKTSLYNIRILGSIAILATSFREWKLFGYGTQPPTISTGDSSEHEQPSTQIVTQTDAMAQHDPHTEVPEQTHSPHSSIDSSSKEQPFNPLYTMKRLDQYIHSPNDEFLSILAKSHYKFFTLGDIIDPDLRKQMAQQSFDLFADIAYSCIKKKRPQRPNIDQVVATLEEALKRQREHDLMQSNPAVKVEGLSLKKKLKAENLEHLNVPFTKIVSATKNFAETHLIGSGTYGKVYKGVLELPVEKKNKNNISKRTVAIKRILFREDEQGIEGFIAEILLLTKCKHPNIVSLLGFCHEGSHMILVYEYASNGSLDAYLGNKYNYLTWEQRIKICIDIAHGLHYLHTREEIDQRIIHRDIKSGNILLGKNLEAKISDFGLSKLYPNRTEARSYYTNIIAGTKLYLDPEYAATGKLKRGTDIYSFGVVLFEILSGKIANDRIFTDEDKKGLAPYAQRRFKEGTLHEMMDPKIMEEVDEHISTLNKGLNQDSLITFSKIAYECLAETQVMRPTAEIIIKELEKALVLQKNHKNKLQISFEDISKATQNFNDDNLIGEGPFCKVYKGEGIHAHGCNTIAVKRLNTSSLQGDYDFLMELEILVEHKRENIMGLVGYYNKEDEKIIVCEYAHNGSLDKHLDDISVSWVKRLNICIDVASGLAFLHKGAPTKEMVIHNDIKSSNILLNDEWKAKITDFGLSVIPIEYNERVGGYVDAPFITKESDIYSFGVVLFEVLSGRSIVTDKHKYDQQDLTATKDIVFEHIERYIAPESLNTFRMIASRCIDDEMEKRPTAEEALGQLKKALEIQKNHKNKLQISFEDISKATQNFNDDNLIGEGPFCKVYKGEGIHAHGCNTIAVKRLNTSSLQGDYDFLMELEILVEHKRENIMGLVGYYNKEDEKIIVCEYAHNGSLDKHLDDISVSWVKRLNICIDVASGLAFLHKGAPTKEMVIHNDIKSSNILLNDEWKAKITDFGLSVIPIEYNERVGGYVDAPFITKESDIYSFGVVLFEVLSGRSIVTDKHKYDQQDLTATKDIVFEHIERYIAPESLNTFRMIASRCIDDEMEKRPTAEEALGQLKKALEIQEGYDIWEPKLPKDYKEIIQMSKSPEIYSDKSKKELYYMFFTEGILLQQDTEWFSFGDKGERNKMISASEFSYINDRSPHEWHPIPESKFKKVAEVLDTTNLMIKIKIRTDLLSPNVTYGVHLLFKFCDSSKVSSKPAYVNLKYKKGSETLYAYFATWRDDNWMTVELCRFLNQEEVKPEKIEPKNDIQHVMESDMSVDQVQQLLTNYDEGEKLFSLTEVNGKKHPILPAKEALHDSTNVRLFTLKSSADSRFHEVIELLPQQVFRIDCKIESHMLSPDTKYVCYLVFKLSEQRDGLHCPVKVRDLLQRKTEEAGIIYLIPPSPWNIHDFIKIPRQRTDELMEVEVWKFNSTHDLKNNCLPMNLRFTSYEGTMSGLIVCGLEFRPM